VTVRPRDLRILQVSTADVRGGAEQVAWNLFRAYRARGYASWLAVGEKHSDDPDVHVIPNDAARHPWARFWTGVADRLGPSGGRPAAPAAALSRLAGAVAQPGRRLDYHRGREDFNFPGTSRLLTLGDERPHVVHAHNLHGGYFDLRKLPRFSWEVPLVLTPHDAWLLSGHCAHSFACERWRTGCGHCPDLEIPPSVPRDATAYNWRRKRAIYARSRLFVATPSRWLMRRVESSILAAGIREARVIPNGVDLSLFHPGDRRAARASLGLPQDAVVLVTTGVKIQDNRWKDFQMLREGLASLTERWQGPPVHLLALGTEGGDQRAGRASLRFVPYEEDLSVLATYYRAADAYVHAARADTFPTAVLEALACGIPVVATGVGGIPEQVEERRSGFLVPPGDGRALAERLEAVLSDADLRARLGRDGAERARRHFSLEGCVTAYLDWYVDLVAGASRRTAA
jgi:glycosyltransferase involved in cell wall biosynthesis